MKLDMQVFQIWKTSGLEDLQTTSRKSSDRAFSHIILSNRSERFGKFLCLIFLHLVFNQMVLIFHLDISGSDFGRSMGSLLRRFVKYNALDDFLQTTSKKSSRRLQGSLPDDF
ncbi:hypothetical protein F2Q68_00041245 [Brassica cretica]|nr:hypothetical protein F2Q68_00041245 [Brassica cretica]